MQTNAKIENNKLIETLDSLDYVEFSEEEALELAPKKIRELFR